MYIALDNYAVHTGQTVSDARPQLAAAQVHLVPLARYGPEQSGIEPVWNDVKQHHLPVRSFEQVADLKRAVDAARSTARVVRTLIDNRAVERVFDQERKRLGYESSRPESVENHWMPPDFHDSRLVGIPA